MQNEIINKLLAIIIFSWNSIFYYKNYNSY